MAKGSGSSAPPLARFLASSEKATRDKAIDSLARFISGRKKGEEVDEEEELEDGDLNWAEETKLESKFDALEMAKLWKGVFYCFWMSDKPMVQQALAVALANLLLQARTKKEGRVARVRAATSFLAGFWEAMVREWNGLDRLRLDKFYLLIRKFVAATFRLLAREQWDLEAIKEINSIYTRPGGPLDVMNPKTPMSLAYHLSDVYVEELDSYLAAAPEDTSAPLVALLAPFLDTLSNPFTSTVYTRVMENVFLPLLPPAKEPPSKRRRGAKKAAVIVEASFPNVVKQVLEAQAGPVEPQVLKALFIQGSKKETCESSRRKLYQLWEERNDGEEDEG